MRNLINDLRYGARMLWKSPGFTLIAVITLALGIGANTAIFSVVNGVLLRPLPYPEPERLMMVRETNLARGFEDNGISMPDFKVWRDRNQVFERIAAFDTDTFNIADNVEPERVIGAAVLPDLFPLLGIKTAQGRAFSDEEAIYGKHRVVVLSAELWARKFGAATPLAGQTIRLNNETFSIVGVMPRGFQFPYRAVTLWVPLALPDNSPYNTRGNFWLSAVARLKPGVTPEQAQRDLENIHRQLAQEVKETAGYGARVVSLYEATVGNVRRSLLTLAAVVACVLLIACVNVANLLLARASARQREMAIRATLGAGRWRIVRQLLTESLMLSALGGACGALLASWGVGVLGRLEPDMPRAEAIGVDWLVLVFMLGLVLLTSLLFGLVPAWLAAKIDLNDSLKEGGRGTASGSNRWLNSLVRAEIALALVLLVGAGLMINSFLRLQRVDPGFRTDNILTMQISLPQAKYPDDRPEQTVGFYQRLIEGVKALPGVQSVGVSTSLPLTGWGWGKLFTREDQPPKSLEDIPVLRYRHVNPDYFDTLGIRLVKGRYLSDLDTRDTQPVALINETMARRFYPNEDPLGKVFKLGPPEEMVPAGILPPGYRFTRFTIVGVVADTKHDGLNREALPEVFVLPVQAEKGDSPARSMYLAVRTATEPAALTSAIRRQVQSLDKEQPVADVATMEDRLANSLVRERFNTLLLALFACVALVLAAVGIYGVMSYSVTRRTNEIGIRMALGANRGDVLRLVLRQGMSTAIIGMGAGIALALGLTQLMRAMLFGVGATDPLTFTVVTALLAAVALLACYLPARRATKVEPIIALRCE